jgi:YhcH/YjgK/YiaL family protein
MILDRLQNHRFYHSLHPRLPRAFGALLSSDLLTAPDGTYEIEGRDLFAIVQRYQTKTADQGRWEAHKKYADIQYVVSGIERMGWTPVEGLEVVEPYVADKDVMFFRAQGCQTWLTVAAGQMALFLPSDAHMPGLAEDAVGPVHKIVVKVLLDY